MKESLFVRLAVEQDIAAHNDLMSTGCLVCHSAIPGRLCPDCYVCIACRPGCDECAPARAK